MPAGRFAFFMNLPALACLLVVLAFPGGLIDAWGRIRQVRRRNRPRRS